MENRADTQSQSQQATYVFELGFNYFNSGKFNKSVPYLRESLKVFLSEKDFSSYISCYRMLTLALNEQKELSLLSQVQEEFRNNCKAHNLEKNPRVLVLNRFYSFHLDKDLEKSQKELGEALEQALQKKTLHMQNQDSFGEIESKLDLMDCLYAYADHYINSDRYEECRKELNNLVLLIEEFSDLKSSFELEISKTNNAQEQQYFYKLLGLVKKELRYISRMSLGVDFMFAQIEKDHKEADRKLWKCYEKASSTGNDYFIPYILTQMSINYFHLNELEQSLTFLNLAEKNLDLENAKILIKDIEGVKGYLLKKRENIKKSYDIIFNKEEHSIFEKQKGCINFKNQFILIDLLKLFISSPGSTYSKQKLVESVWKQEYSPEQHDNKIYVTIKRLRELIEPDINKPRYIFRNKSGYYLTEQTKILIK